jgi:manganese/zinc/iron transport system permease protein
VCPPENAVGYNKDVIESLLRFWSLQDASVRTALAGVSLLGAAFGLLGPFIVLRRLSLIGDCLGHAVLPGVCVGFLIAGVKDPFWMFTGAVGASLLAVWIVGVVTRHSRLKTDVALGLVLSGFFAAGVVLLSAIQNLPSGSQSGLQHVLFGQAAAILEEDLRWIAGVTLVLAVVVWLAWKELYLTTFDEPFAATLGLPTARIHFGLMVLVSLAVAIGLQAVGVVLLSALLVIPASTARLLVHRFGGLTALSVTISVVGAVAGLNLSYLDRSSPTGPYIVIVLGGMFVTALLFAPTTGVIPKRLRRERLRRRTTRENLLKRLPLSGDEWRTWDEAGRAAGVSLKEWGRCGRELAMSGDAELRGNALRLTAKGQARARELERNFRLWEAFLQSEINLPPDHTEAGAEELEHVLGPELVRRLEESMTQRRPDE